MNTGPKDVRLSDLFPPPPARRCPHTAPVSGLGCLRLRGHFGIHEASGGQRWAAAKNEWEPK